MTRRAGCLLAVLFSILALTGCESGDVQIRVPLNVAAMVVPGRLAEGEPVLIKFVWIGGRCLREVDEVELVFSPGVVDVQVWGEDCPGCWCTFDVFQALGTATLPAPPPGSHAVRLRARGPYLSRSGNPCILADTLYVPSAEAPEHFVFEVSAVECASAEPHSPTTVEIGIGEDPFAPDTTLVGQTDSSGKCRFEFETADGDTLDYVLTIAAKDLILPQLWIVRGIPERITIALWPY